MTNTTTIEERIERIFSQERAGINLSLYATTRHAAKRDVLTVSVGGAFTFMLAYPANSDPDTDTLVNDMACRAGSFLMEEPELCPDYPDCRAAREARKLHEWCEAYQAETQKA